MVQQAEPRTLVAHIDSKTAASLVFELFAVDGNPQAGLEAYRTERAQRLIDSGAAWGVNVFQLREQQVPATPLAEGVHSALTPMLAERLGMRMHEEGGPANPQARAVYGAAYQLTSEAAFDAALAPGEARGRRTLSLGAYSKVADFGRPSPVGDDAFQSAMIVFTHPTDIGYVEQFDHWYTDNHMIDAAKSVPYRSATRYRLVRCAAGTPLPYLCIYEIEAPYSKRVHEDMMHQIGVLPWPQRKAQPRTPAGQDVLTIDFWGYYQRVWWSGEQP